MNKQSKKHRMAFGLAAILLGLNSTGAQADLLRVGCPWIAQAININTHNYGYPDSHANYSVMVLPTNPTPDTTVTIHGSFPQARYFSFQADDGFQLGNYVDQVADADLIPDVQTQALSSNPAVLPYYGYDKTYTLTVKFIDAPSDPALREANVLYAGSEHNGATKTVVMRVYLPNPGADYLGDAGLPTLTYDGPHGIVDINQTPDQRTCAILDAGWEKTRGLYVFGIPTPFPSFGIVQNVTGKVLYPNGDSNYIRAATGLSFDDMIVVRGKAATTPVLPPEVIADPQVRYWSVCQNQLNNTLGVACVADREMTVQDDGYYTVVISADAKRPPLAQPEYGYNWLPWGPSANGLVGIRQTLPDPDFAGNYALALANPDVPLSESLGEWAPQITYCDLATFAYYAPAGGDALFQACVAHRHPYARPSSP